MKPTIFMSLILATLVLFSTTDVKAGLIRIDSSATTEGDDLESIMDIFKDVNSLFNPRATVTDSSKRLEELQRLKAEAEAELKHLERLRGLKVEIIEELTRLEELQRLKMKMVAEIELDAGVKDTQKELTFQLNMGKRNKFDHTYARNGFVRTGTDYALLFAISDYEHWQNLQTPIDDVEAIGAELENRYGFNVDIRKNVTIKDILATLAEYKAKRYAPGDQLLVYFTGHGKFDEVLQDGHIAGTESELPMTDEHLSTYLSFNKLRTDLDNFPCERIMLMLDVCYGGTFDENNALSLEEPKTTPSIQMRGFTLRPLNLEDTLKAQTRWYLSFGGLDSFEHSPFAASLLTVLRNGAGDDGVLTLPEIERLLPEKFQAELDKLKKLFPNFEFKQIPASGPFGSGKAADKAFVFIGKDFVLPSR